VDRVRDLTPAEARVIAGLLGSAAASERERLRRIGVPRSTYHAARRRAYSEGWLRDRYVPQPERLGLRSALVLAARPFVDRAPELAERWSSVPSCVYFAAGTELVLGVFVEREPKAAKALSTRLLDGRVASWQESIVADLHTPSIPVYFDYEGLWTHLADAGGTVAYPRGLGGTPEPEDPPTLSDHQRWAASELLARPFAAPEAGRGAHLVGPLGLPFSQQRLVAQGSVLHRVFLDPGRLPPFRGNAADQIVLITGAWRPGARPERLFQALTEQCRVFPFLYVVDPARAMLGALGRSGPTPPGAPEARRPVLATLQESLEGIELVQVLAPPVRTVIDHRYDRLLPRGSGT
jgi:hypothetical protein